MFGLDDVDAPLPEVPLPGQDRACLRRATLGVRKFVLDDPSPLPDLASGGRGGRRRSLSTSSPRRSETDQRQWIEGAVMATYTAAQFLIRVGAGRL